MVTDEQLSPQEGFQAIPGDQSSPGMKDIQGITDMGGTPRDVEVYKSHTADQMKQMGASADDVDQYFGRPKVDTSAMQAHISSNMAAYSAQLKEKAANAMPDAG